MKKVFNFGCLVLILFLASCGKDPKIENDLKGLPHGNFALRLGTMGDFEIVSKSTGGVDVSDFSVRIFGRTLKETNFDTTWVRYADMPAVVTIPAGSYTIEAFNGKQKSGFGTPYYYGKKEFSVGIQELIDAQVVCQLACVKLTVEFTSLFLNNVADAVCQIHQTEGVSLEFDPDKNEGAGYIATPADSTLAITIRGKYIEDGSSFDRTYFIKSVASKQWHKIALSVNTSAGIENGGGMVQVDHSVNEKESTILVPGSDDLIDNNGDTGSWDDEEEPGEPENPGGGDVADKPTIVGVSLNGVAFDIDQPVVLTDAAAEGATLDVELNAQDGGIQNLFLVMTSQDNTLGGIFASMGSSDPNHPMDLANPGDLTNPNSDSWQNMLKQVGLLNPDVPIKGKTKHIFSVGAFMGLLTTPAEGFYEHSFAIKIVDGKGNEVSKTLIVKRSIE